MRLRRANLSDSGAREAVERFLALVQFEDERQGHPPGQSRRFALAIGNGCGSCFAGQRQVHPGSSAVLHRGHSVLLMMRWRTRCSFRWSPAMRAPLPKCKAQSCQPWPSCAMCCTSRLQAMWPCHLLVAASHGLLCPRAQMTRRAGGGMNKRRVARLACWRTPLDLEHIRSDRSIPGSAP